MSWLNYLCACSHRAAARRRLRWTPSSISRSVLFAILQRSSYSTASETFFTDKKITFFTTHSLLVLAATGRPARLVGYDAWQEDKSTLAKPTATRYHGWCVHVLFEPSRSLSWTRRLDVTEVDACIGIINMTGKIACSRSDGLMHRKLVTVCCWTGHNAIW